MRVSLISHRVDLSVVCIKYSLCDTFLSLKYLSYYMHGREITSFSNFLKILIHQLSFIERKNYLKSAWKLKKLKSFY